MLFINNFSELCNFSIQATEAGICRGTIHPYPIYMILKGVNHNYLPY